MENSGHTFDALAELQNLLDAFHLYDTAEADLKNEYCKFLKSLIIEINQKLYVHNALNRIERT